MFRFWQFEKVSRSGFQTAASIFTLLLLTLSQTQAAVTLTPDAGYEGPDRQVYTFNPFAPIGEPPLPPSIGQRNVANTRHLRQTFQNPATFNVGKIVLSLDNFVSTVGLSINFYEVADVNAGSWSQGNLIKTISVLNATTTPLSTESLGFTLTGGDVFTLPARSTGTEGYGIDVATLASNPADGSSAAFNYHTTPAMDYYTGGRFYQETGGGTSLRDAGLALFSSNEIPCDPGDTDCDTDVDADDLDAIASHFRQPGGRELGDLTGNGFIDFDDFGEWKQYYTGPPLPLSAYSFMAVPEPGCLVLLLGGMLGTLSLNARRRGRAICS